MKLNEQIPRQVVEELDKYIVGQSQAKRSVAIALRNRWRSRHLPEDMRDEIIPKNILMIGSTGVGKTEIARRLAKLVKAPFVKVEATKFTEVGYVGRDVESMVRDLAESAVRMLKQEKLEQVQDKAKEMAQERILDIYVPEPKSSAVSNPLSATKITADLLKKVLVAYLRHQKQKSVEKKAQKKWKNQNILLAENGAENAF